MLKKGVLALALVIGMPVYAAEHWIDVRVPEQYQQQHIQGAVNIPLKEMKARIAAEVPDKNDTVKLYCNSMRLHGMVLNQLIIRKTLTLPFTTLQLYTLDTVLH